MIEPFVCVPIASGTMLAATAAAEPEEDPPGVRSVSCGLRVLVGWKYANSVRRRLSDDHRTSGPQSRDHSRVGARPSAG